MFYGGEILRRSKHFLKEKVVLYWQILIPSNLIKIKAIWFHIQIYPMFQQTLFYIQLSLTCEMFQENSKNSKCIFICFTIIDFFLFLYWAFQSCKTKVRGLQKVETSSPSMISVTKMIRRYSLFLPEPQKWAVCFIAFIFYSE